MSLARRTVIGVAWNFAEQLLRRGFTVGVTLLLAFFLTPEDFGLVAMMSVFIALGMTLMESGFQAALIRLIDASQIDLNTAFFANVVLGILAYIILYIAAPHIADFYGQPELAILIRVTALSIIVNSLRVVQVAIVSRLLNFKIQFLVNLPAAIMSGTVAVILAYYDWGVWALVVQTLLASTLITVLLWFRKIWRPSGGVSLTSLKSMYNFSYKLFLSGMLDTIFKNMYLVVVAKLFSATIAGLYFFADRVKELLISQLVLSVQTVTYPALSTLQNDNKKLKEGFRKVIIVTTFILFPVMFFLAALSKPLFQTLLPEEWWPGAVYLQLMLLAGVLYPIHSINLNILTVKGRSDLFLYLELLKKTVVFLILLFSFRYGVIGILLGQIVSSILAYIPNSYFSNRLIEYSVGEQLSDFMPGLIYSGVIGGVIFALQLVVNIKPVFELLIFGVLAAALYLMGARFFRMRGLHLVYELIFNRSSKRL